MDGLKLYADLNKIPRSVYPNLFDYNEHIHFTPDIEDCDFVLLPHWEVIYEYSDRQYCEKGLNPKDKSVFRAAVESLIYLANKHNKRLIVFHFSDIESKIDLQNAFVFRTSLYESIRDDHEYAIPSNMGDLINEYKGNKLLIRSWQEKPVIGFMGSSRPLNPNLMDFMRGGLNIINNVFGQNSLRLINRYQWNKGQILRRKAMKNLLQNQRIQTNFNIKVRGFVKQKSKRRRDSNRMEFVNNIFNSDYTLCARGAGNYSYRFYETLSAGRIPLLLNTDCVLPLDDIIDWKKYCLWVEEDELDQIDTLLLDFHHGLKNDDFIELQIKIRNLWLRWIEDKAYLGKFHLHLQRYMSGNIGG